MPTMRLPIRRILCRQRGIAEDQQIFGVPILSRFREVETAGEDRGATEDGMVNGRSDEQGVGSVVSVIVPQSWLSSPCVQEVWKWPTRRMSMEGPAAAVWQG